MPRRIRIGLEQFAPWCAREVEPYVDTRKAQIAAMHDHHRFSVCDVESTTVHIIHPNREVGTFRSPATEPFLLRVLDTPYAEFRDWREDDGEWLLVPRWHVRILRDFDGRAVGAGNPGALVFILPRVYVARQSVTEAATVK